MQDFPQELTDKVIDAVYFDAGSKCMKTCSLVCRQWLPRSRLHLFSTLRLDSKTYTDRAGAFFQLLDNSPFPILPNVQSLDLRYDGPLDEAHMARLQECRNLRDLGIATSWEDNEKHWLVLQDFCRSIQSGNLFLVVSCLDFRLNTDIYLPVLIKILGGIPSLQKLCITGSYNITAPEETPAPSSPFPPNLHALNISVVAGTGLFFGWVLSLPEAPTFTSLELRLNVDDELDSLEEYFVRKGGVLESLSLAIWGASDRYQVYLLGSRLLQHTTALSELKITDLETPSVLPAILSSIPSSKLEALTIDEYHGTSFLADLAETLGSPVFSTVQSITRVPPKPDWGRFMEGY
ncbi:hypothetical protein B0H16DRAFT_1557477 [Mycena metata]|uniref:F-box domain-containing protein n=1 Tax=Mycena metata TaxID=1033252 RepID=A0AAD7IPI7_9AGAR|nr:hypothetical protein B0H16DRAFT_1557477 [Mycena metata]